MTLEGISSPVRESAAPLRPATRGCPRNTSPLAEALAQLAPNELRLLSVRIGFDRAVIERLGSRPYLAGWVKRAVAEAVGQPVAELFPERFEDDE